MTALLAPPAQAWFEAARRAHYPPALNQVPAHVSLFHHLPGSQLDAVRRRLKAVCGQVVPPAVTVAEVRSNGRGVAYRLRAPELEAVRAELAEGWDTLLIVQDRAGFQPHVTVQNKVTGAQAKATLAVLAAGFVPFQTSAVGVAIWRYLGGPWEALGSIGFRGR